MKLLVFAHTPPPHHGQSYMVQLMLEGFGGNHRKRRQPLAETSRHGIECYHVNARLSKDLEDIGEFRPGKLLLLFRYSVEAIWCRYRYGVRNLYYIPSPGKRSALLRDWIALILCRLFFKRVIFHWHAAGMAKWLETSTQIRTRSMTYRAMKQADLSVVLSRHGLSDAAKLLPLKTAVVANGIPECCGQFEKDTLPRRMARLAARKKLEAGSELSPSDLEETGGDPHIIRVLFLAHCTREKGLFDTMDGVVKANESLVTDQSPLRIQLIVAGNFLEDREKKEFERSVNRPQLTTMLASQPSLRTTKGERLPARGTMIHYVGFAAGENKNRLFREADCFCFPTYYNAESFGLVVVESMAFGLPFVTTRWRALPELLPPDYTGVVDVRAPDQIAHRILQLVKEDRFADLRRHFLDHFLIDRHLENLARALHSVEASSDTSPAGLPSLATNRTTR